MINVRNGAFLYASKGIDTTPNSLLLFQINNEIVACARLKDIEVFQIQQGSKYKGALHLQPGSIQVFKPITHGEFVKICPYVKKFNHAKYKIKTSDLSSIKKLIKENSKKYDLSLLSEQISIEKVAENIDLCELKKRINNPLNSKKTRTRKTTVPSETTHYYRNPFIKAFVIKVSSGKCQLCDEVAPFDNMNGQPYLEVHHIEWLSRNGVDEVKNVVALCPNCHRKMHILDLDIDKSVLKDKGKENYIESQK